MVALKLFTICAVLLTLAFAKGDSSGGYMGVSATSKDADGKLTMPHQNLPFDGARALSSRQCPCKCTSKGKARAECRKLGAFCNTSDCRTVAGPQGSRCCLRSDIGFGRCECLPGRLALGVSFESELSARKAAADFCAERRLCPPDCDCSACAVSKVFCLKVADVWACRADCLQEVTTCRRNT